MKLIVQFNFKAPAGIVEKRNAAMFYLNRNCNYSTWPKIPQTVKHTPHSTTHTTTLFLPFLNLQIIIFRVIIPSTIFILGAFLARRGG
jgi:hypothetical protein